MTSKKLKSIVEELQIPKGYWCNQGPRDAWCHFLEMKNRRYYCNLLEEYISRKECGINE